MTKLFYFLNYKKFMYSGFHLIGHMPGTCVLSYKYFLSKCNNIYILDLRQTFQFLFQLLFFLQFHIKNYGILLFLHNNILLEQLFYSLTHNIYQGFFSAQISPGLFSNNLVFKNKIHSFLRFTRNIIVFYLDNFLCRYVLIEFWRLNVCVIGISSFQNDQVIVPSFLTYLIPINIKTLKSVYFFSFFLIYLLKFSIFSTKFYYKTKYFLI